MWQRACLLGALALTLSVHPAAATTYATWIMVWYGHDQAWWKAGNADASLHLVNGEWKTLDWADDSQYGAYLDGIKKAGVTVVIADLTNGWNWLDARCQSVQRECAKRGMKFCIAENSGGNAAEFEKRAGDVWRNFAGPDAPYRDTYFHYRGKPVIVCYAIRDWYRSYLNSNGPNRNRFSLVWASGEDSSINKWGWQLEPWVGSVPSDDAMYVTSAVRWNPADGAMWRKSLAWLDYNFALARKSKAEYVIVGSYDDPTERNTWCVCDSAKCEPGRQMRDSSGALSTTAHYERVRQWISGKPDVVPGGVLRDGAYRIVGTSGEHLGVSSDEFMRQGAPGTLASVTDKPARAPLGLFWLYHQGNNRYRLIVLASGLALEPSSDRSGIIQNWDSPDAKQRWKVSLRADGFCRLTNVGTGELLSVAGIDQWRLQPVLTL